MDRRITARAVALVSILCLTALPALAATPAPHATRKPVAVPAPVLPKVPLHTEFVVEVNAKGQVVRVKSGKSCKDLTFNAQTYGNVLQMWIRHPDGSAEVGLYKVTYDYNPKTHKVHRDVSLLRPGGTWGNAQGAADQMMAEADKQVREARQKQLDQAKSLPPLDVIVGPSPSPHP